MINTNIPAYLDDMYGIRGKKIISPLLAIDNGFIRQLVNLSLTSAGRLQRVGVITDSLLVRRGKNIEHGIPHGSKSVLDIAKFSPLLNYNNAANVLEEVAQIRWESLEFTEAPKNYWQERKRLLLLDYLLSISVCLVETFDDGGRVDKYYATRNRFLAAQLAKIKEVDSRKYMNHLTPYFSDYNHNQIRLLKLNHTKTKGWTITQPRSSVSLDLYNVNITPVFLITTFLEGIKPVLANNIVKFTFVKDNLTERDLITTTSPQILSKFYAPERVEQLVKQVSHDIIRGYIKLPEVGLSKYDASGVRALTLTRITNMELTNNIDMRFIDVDFNVIIPNFQNALHRINNPHDLTWLYEQLTNMPSNFADVVTLKSAIIAYIANGYSMGTTVFQEQLHLFMMANPKFFPKYDGKTATGGFDISGFGSQSNTGGQA